MYYSYNPSCNPTFRPKSLLMKCVIYKRSKINEYFIHYVNYIQPWNLGFAMREGNTTLSKPQRSLNVKVVCLSSNIEEKRGKTSRLKHWPPKLGIWEGSIARGVDSSYHVWTNVRLVRRGIILFEALTYTIYVRERCFCFVVCTFKKGIKI